MLRKHPAGFTLIELLVVVAIIALLISILLPSLSCARNQAKATKCGAQMRALANGVTMYINENNDWIPGANTTGVGFWMDMNSGNPLNGLRNSKSGVQTFDWITPLLRYDTTDLGNNRAERFRIITDRYQCPTQAGATIDELYSVALSTSADRADFEADPRFAPLSYLMPAHFQYWGRENFGMVLARAPSGAVYTAKVIEPSFDWEVVADKYRSRLIEIGAPARKIAAADGHRFLDGTGSVDFDFSPNPRFFGSFTSSGAWWAGSHEYGVQTPSSNWDDQPIPGLGLPDHRGRNLALSYRHGCSAGVPQSARDNKGSINALFFDGHVGRLGDRASRELDYWYPKGATVRKPNEGMTRTTMGDVVQ
jgi:prepilin-type N-terminal cleavage/methylation domain-containing protein/prepilin-type processing-associated H-X9-DG protein